MFSKFSTSVPSISGSGMIGRLAPTPTGLLHAGHALTFSVAHRRAREAKGRLLLRIEDLDPHRCREEFVQAALEDLLWLGLAWDGDPIRQSARRMAHLEAWRRLRDGGFIYPCSRSRREVSTLAPHSEEPVFPKEWRAPVDDARNYETPTGVNWRFRVPDGRVVVFSDQRLGENQKTALVDFGDFLVWNRDDIPAYELAVVVDDMAAGVTEVVRGVDLLTSTARQILLYEALGGSAPGWFHCPLVCDDDGRRLAKRSGSQSLRELRGSGMAPGEVLDFASRRLDI